MLVSIHNKKSNENITCLLLEIYIRQNPEPAPSECLERENVIVGRVHRD